MGLLTIYRTNLCAVCYLLTRHLFFSWNQRASFPRIWLNKLVVLDFAWDVSLHFSNVFFFFPPLISRVDSWLLLCSNIKTSAFSWKRWFCGKLWISWRSSVLNCWHLFSGSCNKSSGEAQWVSQSHEGKYECMTYCPCFIFIVSEYTWHNLIYFLGHYHIWVVLQGRKCLCLSIDDDRQNVGTTGKVILFMVLLLTYVFKCVRFFGLT